MRIRGAFVGGVLGLGLMAGVANAAPAGVIFQDNFEQGWLSYHWTGNSQIWYENNTYTFFNGLHSYHPAILTIKQAPQPTKNPTTLPDGTLALNSANTLLYTLKFDFYAFDTWDGMAADDRLVIAANGVRIFNESFSNTLGVAQSFREPDQGRANMGGRTNANDAIYRNVSINFAVPWSNDLEIRWQGTNLGVINDESWGIDNVSVSYTVVPTPGAMALIGAGAVLGARRRRR